MTVKNDQTCTQLLIYTKCCTARGNGLLKLCSQMFYLYVPIWKHYLNKKILLLQCPRKLWGKLLPLGILPTGYKRGGICYSHSASFSQRVHISFWGTGKRVKDQLGIHTYIYTHIHIYIHTYTHTYIQHLKAFTDLLSPFFRCLLTYKYTVDTYK